MCEEGILWFKYSIQTAKQLVFAMVHNFSFYLRHSLLSKIYRCDRCSQQNLQGHWKQTVFNIAAGPICCSYVELGFFNFEMDCRNILEATANCNSIIFIFQDSIIKHFCLENTLTSWQ